MDKPRKVKDNVEYILSMCPDTINNNKELLEIYLLRHHVDSFDLPFEAIFRARRRLQEKYPSADYIQKLKKKLEQEYITTYTGGNG